MGMELKGVELSDAQMAAIVPIINRYSEKRRITAKDRVVMEKECVVAMREAGCALVGIGTWLRDRNSNEPVVVVGTNSALTRYRGMDCDGEVLTQKLQEHFEILVERPADAEDF